MKKLILSIFLVLSFVFLFSCKKNNYDAALQGIIGNYTLKSYTVDEIDSLSLYKDSLGVNVSFYNDKASGNYYMKISGQRKDSINDSVVSTWSLVNKNRVIKIASSQGSIGTGPFGNGQNPEWLFIILTNELQIGTTWNGKAYYADLKK